ncbi:MAG TPA: TIGR00366 family protein [Phycisphaerales bacterium]|nr:TIGR00366 family protein [Phycisphaerales bacterium]
MQQVFARVGLAISKVFRAVAPDPLVIAVVLLIVTCGLGFALGDFRAAGEVLSVREKCARLADSFRDTGASGSHMWSLLTFSMQMCLVLVTGHVLASTAVVARGLRWMASIPTTGQGAAAMVACVACCTGVINWGLGLIVGALLAREAGQSLARRGITHHYPIIAAAGYFGLMVWHGGLSGSAPLTMTSIEGARRTLPADVMDRIVSAGFPQGIALEHTLFTPFNLFITGGLLVLVPAAVWVLTPRNERDHVCTVPRDVEREESKASEDDASMGRVPAWLEQSRVVPIVMACLLAAGLWRFLDVSSISRVGLNEIASCMLVLGLVLHGNARSFVRAVDEAAKGCGGIIIQFPIYAAIIAVMVNTGLIRVLADVASEASPTWLPVTTFLSASVINLFVPSGGGQWAVQGPIALQAAFAQGVHPGTIIMSVAYGDQLTNMLQPFWALPLLAITGVKARDIVGYTALVMLLAGLWIIAGLLIFA